MSIGMHCLKLMLFKIVQSLVECEAGYEILCNHSPATIWKVSESGNQ